MKKQDCREGMKVIFGRGNGEKTLAKVVRCNPKRVKVKTLESRGGKAAGENWNVPYSILEEADDYYSTLQVGQVVHYNNGDKSFVRCETVDDDGEMKLKPVAMVGEWSKHYLPMRRLNGSICLSHYPKMIAEGEYFTPHTSCIYEHMDHKGNYDPRNLPAVDLSVAEMTDQEAKIAKLWRIVDATRSALDAGDDPRIRLKVALSILKECETLI